MYLAKKDIDRNAAKEIAKDAAQITELPSGWTYTDATQKEIKKEFDKENIKIPYKQIEVHNGK